MTPKNGEFEEMIFYCRMNIISDEKLAGKPFLCLPNNFKF